MGIILLKMGGPSPLDPEEQVIWEQSQFRAVTSTTFSSYWIGFNLPPLWWIRLLVTRFRCLVLTDFCHCMTQEVGIWYPGTNPESDPEVVTSVSCTKGLFGKCLEIRTCNPTRRQRWLWSPDITLRFFMKNPEPVAAAIWTQMEHTGTGLEQTRTS